MSKVTTIALALTLALGGSRVIAPAAQAQEMASPPWVATASVLSPDGRTTLEADRFTFTAGPWPTQEACRAAMHGGPEAADIMDAIDDIIALLASEGKGENALGLRCARADQLAPPPAPAKPKGEEI